MANSLKKRFEKTFKRGTNHNARLIWNSNSYSSQEDSGYSSTGLDPSHKVVDNVTIEGLQVQVHPHTDALATVSEVKHDASLKSYPIDTVASQVTSANDASRLSTRSLKRLMDSLRHKKSGALQKKSGMGAVPETFAFSRREKRAGPGNKWSATLSHKFQSKYGNENWHVNSRNGQSSSLFRIKSQKLADSIRNLHHREEQALENRVNEPARRQSESERARRFSFISAVSNKAPQLDVDIPKPDFLVDGNYGIDIEVEKPDAHTSSNELELVLDQNQHLFSATSESISVVKTQHRGRMSEGTKSQLRKLNNAQAHPNGPTLSRGQMTTHAPTGTSLLISHQAQRRLHRGHLASRTMRDNVALPKDSRHVIKSAYQNSIKESSSPEGSGCKDIIRQDRQTHESNLDRKRVVILHSHQQHVSNGNIGRSSKAPRCLDMYPARARVKAYPPFAPSTTQSMPTQVMRERQIAKISTAC